MSRSVNRFVPCEFRFVPCEFILAVPSRSHLFEIDRLSSGEPGRRAVPPCARLCSQDRSARKASTADLKALSPTASI
jgi:hypothetical protein